MNPYPIDRIRQDFPILQTQVHRRPLIYLDNAATTQRPLAVLETIKDSYLSANANVHRGVHYLSQLCTNYHEEARSRVARFLNAPTSKEIIFTRGTTEAINLVAYSFGMAFVQEGDEIVISTMEHHANIVPWQMLCQRTGAKLRVVKITETGELDLEHFQSLLSKRTRLVSVCQVSNVLGTVNPIEEVIRIAHQADIPVLIDGAQAVAHSRVDVQKLDADFYVFSSHKVYGPTGIGILYGKEKWLEQMPPYMGGGEMIQKVTFAETTYNELPFKFEAGTPDYIGTRALTTALDYVDSWGLEQIASYEHELLSYATDRLIETFPSISILGTAQHKSGVLSFQLGEIHPFDLGTLLDQMGIAIRTGHHCAEPLLERFGLSSIARVSFAMYNTREEIDSLISALERIHSMIG